jgi:hypothetical protein
VALSAAFRLVGGKVAINVDRKSENNTSGRAVVKRPHWGHLIASTMLTKASLPASEQSPCLLLSIKGYPYFYS